jgi:hypothetical protein
MAILGLTTLTGPQLTYLDQVGNNNATYDLGDYLAYLKAHGYVPAPGMPGAVHRVIAARHPTASPTKKEQ